MNILFIYPSPIEKKNIRYGFSMNIAYASAVVKNDGHKSYFIDLSCGSYTLVDIIKYIQKNFINIVAVEFDSFALKRSDNSQNGFEILKGIKENTSAITVAFGFACMMLKTNISNADITVKDDIITSITSVMDNIRKNNFTYRTVKYNFDDIPMPDRILIESVSFYGRNNKSTLLQTAKGCLNTCSFCQRKGWQNIREEHSIEYVEKEFLYLQKQQYHNVWIVDENFTFNLPRAKEILTMLCKKQYSKNMKLAISSWANIDKEFLWLAKKANISVISMGIETANKEIQEFYNKYINLDKVRSLVEYANGIGLYMVGNFIIGAPNETKENIHTTFEYIDSCRFDQINIKVLDYMIGSDLYDTLNNHNEIHYFCCKENGLSKIELSELRNLKRNFLNGFILRNRTRLQEKIKRYGPPYYPLNK